MKAPTVSFFFSRILSLYILISLSSVCMAQFTPGNIVVDEVYNSSGLTSTGASVYLQEYTTSGTATLSYLLPTTSTSGVINRIAQSGTATSEGQINNSTNMRYAVIPGYDGYTSTTNIATTTSINRIIARVDGSASNATVAGGTGTNTMAFTSSSGTNTSSTYFENNFRTAASADGTAFWLGGASLSGDDGKGTDGVRYTAYNSADATASTVSTPLTENTSNNNYDNIRCVRVYNNTVYYSTSSGSSSSDYSIYSIGTLPTTGTITPTVVLTANSQSAITGPYGFMIFPAGGSNLVMYIVDGSSGSTYGVYKYYYNGTSWTAEGQVLTGSAELYGITGAVSGTTVNLFVTSTTHLYSITDAAGFASSMTGSYTSIATAGTNYEFKGVAYSPGEIVTTASAPGPFGNCTTNSLSVAFTKQGKYTGTYGVQYSNASGIFPTNSTSNLCTGTSTTSPISATLPAGLAAGTGYRLRVIDAGSGAVAPTYYYTQDNGTNITITATTVPNTPSCSTPAAVCPGSAATITGAGSTGATSYTYWTASTGGSAVTTSTTPPGTVASNNLSTPTSLSSGSYTYYVEGDNGTCPSTARQAVTVTVSSLPANPTGTITPAENPACNSTTLAYSAPSASIYWETSAGGTSTSSPTTSAYTLSSTGTVYASAYNGCWSAGPVNSGTITITTGAITLGSSTVSATEVSCSDGTGWTYYADPANLNNWVFAIYKNGNTFTANANLTVKTTNPTQYDSVVNSSRKEVVYTMGRYWNVTLASGSINGSSNPVRVRFYYSPSDTLQMSASARAIAANWGAEVHPVQWFKTTTGVTYSPANNTYTDVPNKLNASSYTLSTGSTGGIYYVEYDGLQGFSGGTAAIRVSPAGYALPVQLLYLDATPIDNNYVRLNWATASETDNSGFEIERSTNGTDFESIGFIPGHGTTEEQNDYLYEDNSAMQNAVYYYRLKQTDVDGNYVYTAVVSAMLIGQGGFVMDELKPNPASGQVVVNVVSVNTLQATVSVTDMLGRTILSAPWQIDPGLNGTPLDISSLSTGMYTVSVRSAAEIFSKRLVITR